MSHNSPSDQDWMAKALVLAEKGRFTVRPNPAVGCVLVKDQQCIGQGYHQRAGDAHAEIHALQSANQTVDGATCYVTLEPCAHTGKTGPCVQALISARIKRCVVGMEDPNPLVQGRGIAAMRAAGIDVTVGVLEHKVRRLNLAFIQHMQHKRPWVTLKLAMSLDGHMALANGKSQWITGDLARFDVQKLRAQQDAMITGSGTVIQDNPRLNIRPEDWPIAPDHGVIQPIRVVCDSQFRVSPQASVFNIEGHAIWAGGAQQKVLAPNDRVSLWPYQLHNQHVPLPQLIDDLYAKGCHAIMIEAGPQLSLAFLQQACVDELIVYQAPCVLGLGAQAAFSVPPISSMADIMRFEGVDKVSLGEDLKWVLCPKKTG